jgi:hypothetical protein
LGSFSRTFVNMLLSFPPHLHLDVMSGETAKVDNVNED